MVIQLQNIFKFYVRDHNDMFNGYRIRAQHEAKSAVSSDQSER